jgi:predicted phage tail protein
MRKVKLYGKLAEFTGRKEIVADIADVGESVRMLVANFAGLDRHMAEREYVVCVGDTSIGLDEINDPIGKSEILITPVISGAGGNLGKILIGAVMIGAAFATGGASLTATGLTFSTASGIGAFGWKAITYIGASLVFGGIAGLLTPTPKTPEETEDPRKSFNFSGITNTSAAGVPVPIVLGRTITGSVVVSAGIDTVQVDA